MYMLNIYACQARDRCVAEGRRFDVRHDSAIHWVSGAPRRCAPAGPVSSSRSAFTHWTERTTSRGWASGSGR